MDPTHDQLCRAMQSVARVMIEMPSVAKQDVQRCEPSITQMTEFACVVRSVGGVTFTVGDYDSEAILRHVIASQLQQQQQQQ